MNTQVNCPEVRPANLQTDYSDAECFQAIDSWVREKEKEWVAVARACMEVQTRQLYVHGGFHSWDAWLENAAPSSARTIRWHISIVKGLEPDFTDQQIGDMPKETAKVVRRLSTKARRDPRVLAGCKRKHGPFVELVKTLHPDELIEDDSMIVFSLSESQREIADQEFEQWRIEHPGISDGEILVALCVMAGEIRRGGRSV